jgi:O-acetyl-ADP-ribose deacetylase (regulator of RNase III)
MSLVVVKGNLLTSDCTVLAHQANCYSTMGAGIAKQIKDRWPEVFAADRSYPAPVGAKRLGKVSHALVDNNTRLVFNLYGQLAYGAGKKQTDYVALESAFSEMLKQLSLAGERFFSMKIGVPMGMGAGLAGGDWNIISEMLDRVSTQYGVNVYAYKL